MQFKKSLENIYFCMDGYLTQNFKLKLFQVTDATNS